MICCQWNADFSMIFKQWQIILFLILSKRKQNNVMQVSIPLFSKLYSISLDNVILKFLIFCLKVFVLVLPSIWE